LAASNAKSAASIPDSKHQAVATSGPNGSKPTIDSSVVAQVDAASGGQSSRTLAASNAKSAASIPDSKHQAVATSGPNSSKPTIDASVVAQVDAASGGQSSRTLAASNAKSAASIPDSKHQAVATSGPNGSKPTIGTNVSALSHVDERVTLNVGSIGIYEPDAKNDDGHATYHIESKPTSSVLKPPSENTAGTSFPNAIAALERPHPQVDLNDMLIFEMMTAQYTNQLKFSLGDCIIQSRTRRESEFVESNDLLSRNVLCGSIIVDMALVVYPKCLDFVKILLCQLIEGFQHANVLVNVVASGHAHCFPSPKVMHTDCDAYSTASKCSVLQFIHGIFDGIKPPTRRSVNGALLNPDFTLCLAPRSCHAMKFPEDIKHTGSSVGFIYFDISGKEYDIAVRSLGSDRSQSVENLEKMVQQLLMLCERGVHDTDEGFLTSWRSWRDECLDVATSVFPPYELRSSGHRSNGDVWGQMPQFLFEDLQSLQDIAFYSNEEFRDLCEAKMCFDNFVDQSVVWMKWESDVRDLIEACRAKLLASTPYTVYTQASLGSKGKQIDVQGILKWYCLGGHTTNIYKVMNRGGKRRMRCCFVLDLTPSNKVDAEYLTSFIALVCAFQSIHIHPRIIVYSLRGMWLINENEMTDAGRSRFVHAVSRARQGVGCDFGDAKCHLISSLRLGAQLIFSQQGGNNDMRRMFVFSGGAAENSFASVAATCQWLSAHQIVIVAISLIGRNLDGLGIPSWLSCTPGDVSHLIEYMFDSASPRKWEWEHVKNAPLSYYQPIALPTPKFLSDWSVINPSGRNISINISDGTYSSALFTYGEEDEPSPIEWRRRSAARTHQGFHISGQYWKEARIDCRGETEMTPYHLSLLNVPDSKKEQYLFGNVWYEDPVSFTDYFHTEFEVSFHHVPPLKKRSKTIMADGMMFVFRGIRSGPINNGSAKPVGSGLGWETISPSVGISLDTFRESKEMTDERRQRDHQSNVGLFTNGEMPIDKPTNIRTTECNVDFTSQHKLRVHITYESGSWELMIMDLEAPARFRKQWTQEDIHNIFKIPVHSSIRGYVGFTSACHTHMANIRIHRWAFTTRRQSAGEHNDLLGEREG
jgi:hypothetical protein